MSTVRPKVSILDDEQKSVVHNYSLKILSSVGISVDSAQARDIFKRAIGKLAEDNRVRIPIELVNWAL